MTAPRSPFASPDALLLDFGGVVMLTSKPDGGREAVAAAVAARLSRAGHHLTTDVIAQSFQAGRTALKHWKHASSRRRAPREMTQREIVADFLASDLPDGARELLVSEAAWLLDLVARTISGHTVRTGIPELLTAARQRGVPVGIVSNAHSGRTHRQLLAEHGLEGIAVQVYSDEVGVRKPNPAIMRIATEALDVDPGRCWYVGDTFDRDVVTARRAGIGTVILTASQHTASPPFPVRERPDAVYDDPRGLLDAFLTATALRSLDSTDTVDAVRTVPDDGGSGAERDPALGEKRVGRGALLIDHGGVISTSYGNEDGLRHVAAAVSELVSSPTEPLDTETALALVAAARAQAKVTKRETGREVPPRTFWVDLVGQHLSARQRALLLTEAEPLTYQLGLTKSHRTLRDGVVELLRTCRERDLPVVVVSNTVSGRAVRAICQAHGIDGSIAAYICSDELGSRKPDPALVHAALRAVGADAAHSWFLGDKPHNDAAAASAAGVPRRVLVRGGTGTEDALQAALASGLATDVVDHPGDLRRLMTADHPVPTA